ncbi:MAG: VWA domain-containing protein [Actinomycetota bacterium]|nr:VWA domain-containing protein [Actinomycetota bacterium]
MTFQHPARLAALAAVGLMLVGYLLLHRRRRPGLVFPAVPLLLGLVARRAWRRHVASVLLLAALVPLTLAFARPTAQVKVPRSRATIVVALDVSASMQATDVLPSRLAAAQRGASDFVRLLPKGFDVGLVSFDGVASLVVSPRADHGATTAAVAGLTLGPGTAIGDAVLAALDAVRAVPVPSGQSAAPARIVLLSDGGNTAGRTLAEAEAAAAAARVPVSTIAYGTPGGYVVIHGQVVPVPVDVAALGELAHATGGQAYTAQSGGELAKVYRDIAQQVGFTSQPRDVTAGVAAVGGLLLIAALGCSLIWRPRL